MTTIKLVKAGELEKGTIRLQSQLYIGRNTADFILKDGILKCWSSGHKGFDFYETKIPYEIVENIKSQSL